MIEHTLRFSANGESLEAVETALNKFFKVFPHFDGGYTLISAKGRYNGKPEDSFILTMINDSLPSSIALGQYLKKRYNQESILMSVNGSTLFY